MAEAAVVQQLPVPVGGVGELGVGAEAVVDEAGNLQAELHLVHQQALAQAGLEELQLAGVEIADAEVLHFPGGLQLVKGLPHLLRLHQSVGPVEQEQVQVVGAQAPQDAVYAVQDVLLGEVVHTGADAALALEHHLVPQAGLVLQHLAEGGLAVAAAVDVGVVEEGDAAVQRGADVGVQLFSAQLIDAHTAQGDFGAQKAGTT